MNNEHQTQATMKLLRTMVLYGCSIVVVSSFTLTATRSAYHATTTRNLFFADAPTTKEDNNPLNNNVRVSTLDGSETSIYNAAKILVDAFWLQSPQQLINTVSDVSDSEKASLITIQADDLMGKYGERMGKRKLDALMLAAFDDGNESVSLSTTDNVLGLVTIEVRLLDTLSKDILNADTSERMLTQAVASLGPKQRREYKDSSVFDIATELLPPEITAVCSLSNLCVAPSARRRGVAAALCNEAERVAKEKLGFNKMYLRVETENNAAKKLYEEKLGYECKFEVNAKALRVDGDSGRFVEIKSDIVVMGKSI